MDDLLLRPFDEWMTEDSRDSWLVEGMVHEGGTAWFAHRGEGKSLLTVDLAVAMAKGEEKWLGRKIRPDSGRILFLVSDPRAVKETSTRLAAMGAPEGSVIVGRLRRGPPEVQWWMQLAGEIEDFRMVVVDSGTNLVHDIVKAEFVNPLLDGLTELVEAKIPVLLVHHMPKTGNSGAGGYFWEAWPRWSMYMNKAGDGYKSLAFEGNAVTELPATVVVRMPRKTHPGSRFALADSRGADPEIRSLARIDRDDALMRRIIEGQPWGSQTAIGRALDVSQPKVSRVLKDKGFDLSGGRIVPRSDPAIHSFPPYNPPAE
jgi:hypothetical protein